MSLAVLYSRARLGMDAPQVTIEVHLSNGLPGFTMVGLPETAVKEARDRVRSAILNSQFDFPDRRITVNMAPADLPKQGAQFDLAIALGILVASDQIKGDGLEEYEFLGELSLSGDVRAGPGALPAAIACTAAGRTLVTSLDNANEAALASDSDVRYAEHLLQVTSHFRGQRALPRAEYEPTTIPTPLPELADVKGQQTAKRALEIAAAGRHNLLFFGPPGTGKTLLASRLPGLLPPLDEQEALEVASVHSICGMQLNWGRRPFRSPHHTASGVSLIGGGSIPRPGEVTLAHRGVLFLDELAEFPRSVLDVLREPLESGEVHISRAARQTQFPANFQLVAAMNPTPGGYSPDDPRSQRYTREQMQRYISRLSGPFLDRIDLHIEVPTLPREMLTRPTQEETTAEVQKRVVSAWNRQMTRQGCANADLGGKGLEAATRLGDAERALLENALDRLGLSARAYHRILKVARTVADLRDQDAIDKSALIEALNCRQLEKLLGGQSAY
ncbi:YifB family Mg chelatase-like AAA ATPase [Saccharospirillum salsuginis]|uniref:ATP-dependent protease n=1 Tax=Saccharospirillum salsuginis TaxID=418750 RepID=A0A918KCU5_9GAMM|nr:YifB family Mg chelatase-like AAA ATPase [Saccharospirillum salsuginis]GGX58362.1 ATP-dependent protease [Saccharospirillum salsuginis]